MALGETIRALRQGAGLTQEGLAERMEVSRQAVAKWESGERAPDLNNCAALAEPYSYAGIERRLLRWRTIQTVLLTVMGILIEVRDWLEELSDYILAASAVVYIVVGLCLMAALFALRKFYREDPPLQAEKS